jgi:pimeloyl-ACP methyl ester carboxylesterase
MVRHKVPDALYQGVVVTNPGGPGGSGLGFSALGVNVPRGAGLAYDWIGFDPRGVGHSEPALHCDNSYFNGPRPDHRVATAAAEKVWLQRTAAYTKACGKHADLLRNMRTVDTVRDIEALRVALGQEKINYYGFSYGTYIGQIYATMFPERVRRMVFDGTVDPRGIWYSAQLEQNRAFEKVIGQFFAWIGSYDGIYHLGTTGPEVAKRFYAARDALARKPVGRIGPSEWTDTFLRAGYTDLAWPQLADAMAAWINNSDIGPVDDTYQVVADVGDDNGFAVYNAVQCTDNVWPKSFDTWRADAKRTLAAAPFNTWSNLWFNAPCLYWPVPGEKAAKIDGRKAPPFLMINTTLDGATPYAGSLEVRRRFPGARLIAEPGKVTHSNSLSGNPCVDDRIAAYLATGELPPRVAGNRADFECAPLPPPQPYQMDPLGLSGSRVDGLFRTVLPMRS